MAVLVTGASGYIGSHTCVALHESQRSVVLFDNLSRSSPRAVDAIRRLVSEDMAFVEGDVASADDLDAVFSRFDIDEVVHFAGLKAVGESVADPLAYYRVNVGGTTILAEAMVRHGVSYLVFSSSAAVYGEPETLPVAETASLSPTSPYGRSKLLCEQVLADAADAHPLDVLLLRYFNPVGAHPSGTIGEDPVGVPQNLLPFIMQVAVGRRERLSIFGSDYGTPDGTAIRDYLHVDDLAAGHVAALDALGAQVTGCRAVNLGTGNGYSVREVLDAAQRAVGSAIPHELVERRPGDVAQLYADSTLARELLGWQATRSLDDMVRDHWAWQQRNPDGFGS
jgi:UDP-glucose 4-epimerase